MCAIQFNDYYENSWKSFTGAHRLNIWFIGRFYSDFWHVCPFESRSSVGYCEYDCRVSAHRQWVKLTGWFPSTIGVAYPPKKKKRRKKLLPNLLYARIQRKFTSSIKVFARGWECGARAMESESRSAKIIINFQFICILPICVFLFCGWREYFLRIFMHPVAAHALQSLTTFLAIRH